MTNETNEQVKISPILSIGRFGTHIMETPAGTFRFSGEVPVVCDVSYKTYDDALNAFIAFFKSMTIEWQREHVGSLRNDVFVKMMEAV
jgi:hypothetical protein